MISNASPEAVYKAPAFIKRAHSAFTGSKAVRNSRVGGKFTAWHGYISGKSIELVKAKKIVQEWKTTEWPEHYGPSTLKFYLKKNRGIELSTIQSKVPESQVRKYDTGWHSAYWKPMNEYLAKTKSQQREIGYSTHCRDI